MSDHEILLSGVALNNAEEAKKILAGSSAEINQVGAKGFTALHGASISGFTGIVRLLLEHKANTEIPTKSGEYKALHFAAMEGHKEIVQLLLENGADPNSKDSFGNTPIWRAGNKEEIGRLIMKFGGDPSIENKHGMSPMNAPAMAYKYLKG